MKLSPSFIWLFFFGSLWGLNELFMGSTFYSADLPYASVYLTGIAFFILAMARGISHKKGTSSAVGVLAGLYRLANSAYICHVVAIMLVGVAFDLVASLFLKKEQKMDWRLVLCGGLTPFLANAFFVIMMTVVQYEVWIGAGSGKAFNHIFVNGAAVSLVSVALVPLGFFMGNKFKPLVEEKSQLVYSSVAVLGVLFWIVPLI